MRPPTGGSTLSPQQSSVGESSRDDGEWAAKIDEISAEHLKVMWYVFNTDIDVEEHINVGSCYFDFF